MFDDDDDSGGMFNKNIDKETWSNCFEKTRAFVYGLEDAEFFKKEKC